MKQEDIRNMTSDVNYIARIITTQISELYMTAYEAGKKAAEELYNKKEGDHEN